MPRMRVIIAGRRTAACRRTESRCRRYRRSRRRTRRRWSGWAMSGWCCAGTGRPGARVRGEARRRMEAGALMRALGRVGTHQSKKRWCIRLQSRWCLLRASTCPRRRPRCVGRCRRLLQNLRLHPRRFDRRSRPRLPEDPLHLRSLEAPRRRWQIACGPMSGECRRMSQQRHQVRLRPRTRTMHGSGESRTLTGLFQDRACSLRTRGLIGMGAKTRERERGRGSPRSESVRDHFVHLLPWFIAVAANLLSVLLPACRCRCWWYWWWWRSSAIGTIVLRLNSMPPLSSRDVSCLADLPKCWCGLFSLHLIYFTHLATYTLPLTTPFTNSPSRFPSTGHGQMLLHTYTDGQLAGPRPRCIWTLVTQAPAPREAFCLFACI